MTHRPRKRFGQNFLQDPIVVERIIRCIAPAPDERIVEIGPGTGAITAGVLQVLGRLEAIELDRDLIFYLRSRCAPWGRSGRGESAADDRFIPLVGYTKIALNSQDRSG